MNQKKKLQIVAGIMLIIASIAVVPTAQADNPHSIKGTLFIYDGQNTYIAPAGIDIEIEFLDGTETTTTYTYNEFGNNTNYNLGFWGHDSESDQPGYFTVIYQSNELIPIDNQSITIEEETIGYFVNLTVNISSDLNNPPNTPTLVAPTPSGKTGVSINPKLEVRVTDPDGDSMTVTFYDASDDSIIGIKTGVSNNSKTSVTWSSRSYSTTYNWYVIAADLFGSTQSSTWSFTTKDKDENGGNGGDEDGGGGGGAVNIYPKANAGGPYVGTEGEEIEFDGSGSSDSDGNIVSWEWDFGDGSTGSGETTTHTYSSAGTYTVTLTVTDNGGFTNTVTTTATIGKLNNPPTTPVVTGPKTGDVDTDYDYTAMSTDADDDEIQYLFDWGDGTDTTTTFVENGTEVTESHSWSSYGFYTVEVTAYDNQTYSGTKEIVVAIDVMWVKNIGYLIDADSDGVYESFYSNETGTITSTKEQTQGDYLITSDEDEQWDWDYDSNTDTLTEYSEKKEGEEDYTWLYLLIIAIIIILIIIGAMAGRKKKPESKSKDENSNKSKSGNSNKSKSKNSNKSKK